VINRQRPAERLEKTLARVAREQGLDQERLRRWVSFLALCGVLEKALAEGILGGYYLKGGVAMELRFAQRARATKDLDLGLTGNRSMRLKTFEEALRLGFDQFSFRLKSQARDMELADTVRIEVAIQYRTRAWQTIEIDLGPGGAADIDYVEPTVQGLHEVGIPITSPVRCLSLSEQVAQKLHACTAPGTLGSRARDVLDILLIDLLGELNYSATRKAAVRVFCERATHEFPPNISVPAIWVRELEAMAPELGLPAISAAEIEQMFRAVVQRIIATNSRSSGA
jgi:Nucleotidyl transferase AbiEii toxin, Type IV TA system